jgi:hypothetical protein
MILPEEELSFYFAALAQLEPELRPIFVERVAATLGAYPHCDVGPGDVDRAIRSALVGLWTPPPITELQKPSRWDRDVPDFERASKRAW